MKRTEERGDEEKSRLDAIRSSSPDLAEALELADGFAELIRERSEATLSDRVARAETSPCLELGRFAEGMRRDEAAVQEAVTGPWSKGPVRGPGEPAGWIRQKFGRAGSRLLSARGLYVA